MFFLNGNPWNTFVSDYETCGIHGTIENPWEDGERCTAHCKDPWQQFETLKTMENPKNILEPLKT